MRTVTILNYTTRPPQVLARLVLADDGHVTVTASAPDLRAQLAHGVLHWPSKRRIRATDGAAFLDQALVEFSGGVIRAVEEPSA